MIFAIHATKVQWSILTPFFLSFVTIFTINTKKDGGTTTCSYACMDVNYTERIGIYYPNKGDSVANMDGCPLFWRNESNKVTIDPAVLNVHFFHGMGAVAYSAGMVSSAVLPI